MEQISLNVIILPNTSKVQCDKFDILYGEYLIDSLKNFPNLNILNISQVSFNKAGLIIIDPRAWFTKSALFRLFYEIQRVNNCVRFVESNESIFNSYREALTLVFYIPLGLQISNFIKISKLANCTNIEEIIDHKILAKVTNVKYFQFDIRATMITTLVDRVHFARQLLLDRVFLAIKNGVQINDPNTVYIRGKVNFGSDVCIDVNVIFEGDVNIGNGVKIGANTILRNCHIGDGATINPFSLIEESSIGSRTVVGPYGRVRPGCIVGNDVQIGNYVEIKNSNIGNYSRINHHTFIGDALIANCVTLGAGTITCNHDGVRINQTIIESGAYIGSGCNLVAPIKIGKNAVIGAGSTITKDVPASKLTIARQQQKTIENWTGPKKSRTKK